VRFARGEASSRGTALQLCVHAWFAGRRDGGILAEKVLRGGEEWAILPEPICLIGSPF
jgi:hypothetical protein